MSATFDRALRKNIRAAIAAGTLPEVRVPVEWPAGCRPGDIVGVASRRPDGIYIFRGR